jgi:hypothetical protein
MSRPTYKTLNWRAYNNAFKRRGYPSRWSWDKSVREKG